MVSLPLPPLTVSSPPRARTTSLPFVPLIVSLPGAPMMVHPAALLTVVVLTAVLLVGCGSGSAAETALVAVIDPVACGSTVTVMMAVGELLEREVAAGDFALPLRVGPVNRPVLAAPQRISAHSSANWWSDGGSSSPKRSSRPGSWIGTFHPWSSASPGHHSLRRKQRWRATRATALTLAK